MVHTYEKFGDNFLSEINETILYDTDKADFKIICGRKKNNEDDTKCILANPIFKSKKCENIDFDIEFENENGENVNFKINFYNINEIKTIF